jgi:hypothetical protein
MTPSSQCAWERIVEAFPPVLPAQPITRCACAECLNVRADLGRLRWNDPLSPSLQKQFGSLPLLADEAFCALLPAFLFCAPGDVSPKNEVLEFTLYALCGAHEEDQATKEATAANRRLRMLGSMSVGGRRSAPSWRWQTALQDSISTASQSLTDSRPSGIERREPVRAAAHGRLRLF